MHTVGLKELYYHIMWYAVTVAIVVVLVFLIVFLLLSKFHHSITRPIFDLVGLMQIVSRDKNYAVRASINSMDETGKLAM
jgi:sensor histidine kinase YesM